MPSQSSGDPVLDRRFGYAEACAESGDPAAAADILAQIVAERPDWAAAWFRLGEARLAASDADGAAEAFRRAEAADPGGILGAGVALAALGQAGESGREEMPAAFVATLFDQYAPRFDTHLTEALDYRGPAIVTAALARVCAVRGRAVKFARCLDLGCGTGLFGAAIRAAAGRLEGVDLSAAMLAQARRKGLYDRLEAGTIDDFLAGLAPASADLVVACDVFPYVGDLAPIFAAAARTLSPGGLFAFTVQAGEGDGFAIGADRRFAHARPWLENALAAAGLSTALFEPASTRADRGRALPGFLVVAESGLARALTGD